MVSRRLTVHYLLFHEVLKLGVENEFPLFPVEPKIRRQKIIYKHLPPTVQQPFVIGTGANLKIRVLIVLKGHSPKGVKPVPLNRRPQMMPRQRELNEPEQHAHATPGGFSRPPPSSSAHTNEIKNDRISFTHIPGHVHKRVKNRMRLAIFGSTGNIGREVLKAALNEGHEVQTLVRSPSRLTTPEVQIIEGNLADKDKIQETIKNAEAVLWAIGATRKTGDNLELYREALKICLDEMRKNRIRRIVLLAGEAMEMPGERFPFSRKMKRFILRILVPHIAKTNKALRDILLQNEDLDWTILRPAFIIVHDKPAGKVEANTKKISGGKIDAADLGEFFVDQVSGTRFIREAPFLASLYR